MQADAWCPTPRPHAAPFVQVPAGANWLVTAAFVSRAPPAESLRRQRHGTIGAQHSSFSSYAAASASSSCSQSEGQCDLDALCAAAEVWRCGQAVDAQALEQVHYALLADQLDPRLRSSTVCGRHACLWRHCNNNSNVTANGKDWPLCQNDMDPWHAAQAERAGSAACNSLHAIHSMIGFYAAHHVQRQPAASVTAYGCGSDCTYMCCKLPSGIELPPR